MDYKDLLKKYMEYLVDVEGSDFVNPVDRLYMSDVAFTKSEWNELLRISRSIQEGGNAHSGQTS